MEAFDRILVPVADEDDAVATARAVSSHFADSDIVGVTVIEKGGGTLDKAPLAAAKERADGMLAAFEEAMRESGAEEVETKKLYGTDVARTILDEAEERGAAVAFAPRRGGRLVRFLSGDDAYKLMTRNRVPVVSLPRDDAS